MGSVVPGPDERRLLENLFEGVYYVDRERRITYWNAAAERISGFTCDEVTGKRCMDGILTHVDEAGASLCAGACPLLRTMLDGRPREARVYLHHRDGHRVPVSLRTAPILDAGGGVVGGVEVFREGAAEAADVDELEAFRRRAQIDELTGVANRGTLSLVLQAKIEDQRRFGWPFGVVMLDIDHFKAVNDTHGHLIGDRALQVVARTLAGGVRRADVVGRFGGEEFMVVAPMIGPTELVALAERLRRMIAASTVAVEGGEISLTASLGATLARPGDDVETVTRRVDALLYRSKREGRDRVSCEPPPGDPPRAP